jgi:hypothetical protein
MSASALAKCKSKNTKYKNMLGIFTLGLVTLGLVLGLSFGGVIDVDGNTVDLEISISEDFEFTINTNETGTYEDLDLSDYTLKIIGLGIGGYVINRHYAQAALDHKDEFANDTEFAVWFDEEYDEESIVFGAYEYQWVDINYLHEDFIDDDYFDIDLDSDNVTINSLVGESNIFTFGDPILPLYYDMYIALYNSTGGLNDTFSVDFYGDVDLSEVFLNATSDIVMDSLTLHILSATIKRNYDGSGWLGYSKDYFVDVELNGVEKTLNDTSTMYV